MMWKGALAVLVFCSAGCGRPTPDDADVLAPGIVSTGGAADELQPSMSPDGRELYFVRRVPGDRFTLFVSRRDSAEGEWGEPEPLRFSGTHGDQEPSVSRDGRRLYFTSDRPAPGETEPNRGRVPWVAERDPDAPTGWTEPRPLAPGLVLARPDHADLGRFWGQPRGPVEGPERALYFWAERPDALGHTDLYRAEPGPDGFSAPVNLGAPVNSERYETSAAFAPDGSWIVFGRDEAGDGYGLGDLYVSHRTAHGWGEPRNLGPSVNSPAFDASPAVSADGRALLFSSNREREGNEAGRHDIYVVPLSALGLDDADEPAAGSTADLAIVGATVIPMDGAAERVPDATVLIAGDSILAIDSRSSIEVPDGARIVDARGRFIVPGLTDAHVHLRSERELLSYLRHGVTTIWNLSGTPSGAPDILATRRAVAAGDLLGPTIYTTGPMLDGDPPNFAAVSTVVTEPPAADSVVAAQARRGYDFLKIYNGLPPDVMEAAISMAHARGMPAFGHVPRQPERSTALQRALDTGLDVIAHGEEVFFTYAFEGVEEALDRGEIPHRDDETVAQAAELVAETGTAVIPNLSFIVMTRWQLERIEALREDPRAILADPEARYLAPGTREMWTTNSVAQRTDLERFERREQAKLSFVQRLTRALSAAGVPLFAGTDASAPGLVPGASLHLELRELVVAGLTPYEALASATRDPGGFVAQHVERAPRSGVIVPGARADLVLLAGDPLADIANSGRVEGVVVRGLWLTVEEIDALRAAP